YKRFEKGGSGIAGLHVNFSLWNEDENVTRTVTSAAGRLPKNSVTDRLMDYIHTDGLLIAPSDESYQRLSKLNRTNKNTACCQEHNLGDTVGGGQGPWIEFRAPAADARHDLSTLMVLTAIYQGLAEKAVPVIPEKDLLSLAQSKKESVKRFK